VTLAELGQPASPYLRIRQAVVLREREALLDVVERLRGAEPVAVSVLAALTLLLQDESSPVYVGGDHPRALATLTTRCLRA
jgi:hypothetical protein